MPVRGRGAFPAAPATYRDDGSSSGVGLPRQAGGQRKQAACIAEYRAMKQLPRYQHALDMLRRVGNAVQPIMALRGWRLPLLVEIYPAKDNLLGFNVNAGRKIALRLRRPHDQDDFIDEESVVETMLHELAHNLRGPHDEIFEKHLDELTRQWQELRQGHYLPGQGFLTGGHALGTSATRNEGIVGARNATRRAAEGRLRNAAQSNVSRVLGGGRGPIGNSGLFDHLTPREAALIAAERRRAISNACPSDDAASTQEVAKEQEDDEIEHGVVIITIRDEDEDGPDGTQRPANPASHAIKKRKNDETSRDDQDCKKAVITLDDEDDDDPVVIGVKSRLRKEEDPEHRRSTRRQNCAQQQPARAIKQMHAAAALRSGLLVAAGEDGALHGSLSPRHVQDVPAIPSAHARDGARTWTCQACTLLNAVHTLQCRACDTVRPGVPAWTCVGCGHVMLGEEQAVFWCCKECGRVKVA